MTATGSQIRGNLARTSSGGGILNAAEGGSALVSLASTSVSRRRVDTLNPNRAEFGAGIYSSGDGADITVGAGASIVRNVASIDGGGIFSECDGTISVLPRRCDHAQQPQQHRQRPNQLRRLKRQQPYIF